VVLVLLLELLVNPLTVSLAFDNKDWSFEFPVNKADFMPSFNRSAMPPIGLLAKSWFNVALTGVSPEMILLTMALAICLLMVPAKSLVTNLSKILCLALLTVMVNRSMLHLTFINLNMVGSCPLDFNFQTTLMQTPLP